MNALLLEDDPLVAQDLQDKLLKLTDIENVIYCKNINEANQAISKKDFQISFIDIEIDDKFTGLDIAKNIKEKMNAGVIYITGYSDDDTIDQISKTYPDGYILKPYNERQLIAITKQTLMKYGEHAQLGNIKLNFQDEIFTDSKIELFQAVINSLYMVSITDTKGKIIFTNDAFSELSGYGPEELLGKNHNIVNSGHHSKTFFKKMWQTLLCGNIWRGDICNRKKDGELYWVSSTIFPLKDELKRTFFMSIRTDVTSQKSLEKRYQELLEKKAEELLESQYFLAQLTKTDQINNFAATLSHEIKKPLSSISMQLSALLYQNDQLPEDVKDKLKRLNTNTKKTAELANFINNIFKHKDNKEENLVLNDLIQEIIDFSKQIYYYEEISFLFDQSEIFNIKSSKEILFITIFNLVKNAAEALETVKEERKIRIEIKGLKSSIKIIVQDNGPGISEEIKPNLFQGKINTSKASGSGLGLAISRSLIRSLNGVIQLEKSSKTGTSFSIKLPKL